ncbi:MAG: DUF58 domain-containing protein [Clostridiales bacterium]|jgi:hypothetical protein|nr:DUF58 domain-containing protein [Clostridiales bacterium]
MDVIPVSLTIVFFILLTNVIYRKFWSKNLTLNISFSSKEAFCGEKLVLTEVLTNSKLLPLPWVSAKFQVSQNLIFPDANNIRVTDDYYKNDLFSILPFQKITRRLEFVCGKRGFYKIKSSELLSHNLLFTQKYVANLENAAYLTVYPKLLDIEDLNIESRRIAGEVLSKRFINPDYFEFRGIREYLPFDDFKTINFKATAKANRLMVNMYEHTVSNEIVIFLNFEAYSSWVSLALFEETISLAASLAKFYIGKSIPVRVVSGSRDIIDGSTIDTGSGASAAHLYRIYESLARLDLNGLHEPIINFLPDPVFYLNESKIHILISTFRSDALQERFNALKQGFSNIYWILPYTRELDFRGIDENINMWEAGFQFEPEIIS